MEYFNMSDDEGSLAPVAHGLNSTDVAVNI